MTSQTMNHQNAHHADDHEHDHHQETIATKYLGFWIYLMSDCVLFGTLFATYAVLMNSTAGGPGGPEIFELGFVLIETFLLLFSSFTYGVAVLAMHRGNKSQVLLWLVVTFLLGFGFVAMEVYEFSHLIHEGYGPDRSAFLSSFFTLVGTHGLHVSFGLLWMLVLIFQVARKGLTPTNQPRIMCLSLFWHFLDVIWICVFTVVYLLGVLQ
ncbi:cytochrome o ubiquinol oxidase subunit III [Kushneria phosphatilytica]|uniref:Cytochrome bo(3) ubiquinol oxidase subunit 3 n=1 Tax=Kushneria phosphatilytica TaxID=657387 RepID=A0A1S1NWH8_9GAMM|nr:cytochrome o ubiquinol oxidase subunit III [Kushneria phosphatilytica]OHV11555.1 cytochrome o ubiquinol oxidase subunit III [Kushneria phosphatilytica]QEL12163.1 cytochrome o ubiquinol oxidase subunit III [Kushneria phosphatilytica]